MATKLKTKRLNIQGAMTPGKVLAIVDDDTMEAVENGGGGGVGVVSGFNEAYNEATYKAVETIVLGQHCCKQTYTGIALLNNGDGLWGMSNPIVNKKYAQTFYLPVTGYVSTIAPHIRFFDGYQSFAFTCDASIYAISGTYGVDAVPTGPALYTAPQQGGTTGGSGATSNRQPAFVFNTIIPAGYYCIEFTLNFGGGGGLNPSTSILGDNTSPAYTGNTVENSITPHAGENMYMNLVMTPQTVVAVADANDIARTNWIGKALESKNADENILVQNQGEINQTGAINDGAIRYLSDTAGELSLTPGTNVRMIAQGSGTDKAWMGRTHYHEMNDINEGEVYYTNTGGLCGGWFKNAVGSFVTTAMSISVSEDNITRYILQSNQYDQSTGGQSIGIQAYIPAGYYFKIESASTTTITSEKYYFNPIK